jgi:hypothetical protein
MNKKIITRAVWFVAVLVVCAGVFLWLGIAQNKNNRLPAPRPDAIATSTTTDGSVRIENKTAGYAMTVPQNWYLEKSAGSGITVYPDHDATSKTPPDCKIEVSKFSNPDRREISDWLAGYFTRGGSDTQEISEEAVPTPAGDAVIWRGVLNDVSTTLAYITSGTVVYELAPSIIMGAGSNVTTDADCGAALDTILKNFELLK